MAIRATVTLPACLRVCNCAGCGKLLVGLKDKGWYDAQTDKRLLPPLVKGRMLGRPYCGDCLKPVLPAHGGKQVKPGPHRGEDDPYQQIALKNWENEP